MKKPTTNAELDDGKSQAMVTDLNPTCSFTGQLSENLATEKATDNRDTENLTCTTSIPNDIWSANQQEEWKEHNPWLFCHEGNLGCTTCKEAAWLLLSEKGGQLSEEWMSGVASTSVAKQMRKKMYKHRESAAHQKAVIINSIRGKVCFRTWFQS